MPIHTLWNDTEQRSINIIFTTPFELSDWYQAISQVCNMLNKVQHPVNIILDMSALDYLPMSMIENLNTSKPRYHINQYAQVAIVNKQFVHPMRTLLHDTDLFSGTHVVSTYEEANRTVNALALLLAVS